MKNKRLFLFIILLMIVVLPSRAQQDSVIDDIGDIAFVALSSGNQDGYAFVLMDDCPNGTSIKFIDEEWTGSSFYSANGEGENTWTNNTGNFISKGTVIIVENADNNPSVNLGSISESNAGFDIATSSPDQIFAIIGSRASPTFLAMIGHTTLPNNGAGSQQTLNGTGLVADSTCIHLTSEKMYAGSLTCDTLSNCLTTIHSDSNWQSISTNFVFPDDVPGSFGGAALPVTLTSFFYIEQDNALRFIWQTAQELNNFGFMLQSRNSTSDWQDIEFIPGHGTHFILSDYTYLCEMPTEGTWYFRLKQMDYDGQHAYSNTLRFTPKNDYIKGVKWTQSNEGIVIKSYGSTIDEICIFDGLGRLVHKVKPDSEEVTLQETTSSLIGPYLYALVVHEGRQDWLMIPVGE